MRVTVTMGGSRGEVQPYVALGSGLKAAGHQVRVATQAPHEEFVRGRGLECQTHVSSSQCSKSRATIPLDSRDGSGASWDH